MCNLQARLQLRKKTICAGHRGGCRQFRTARRRSGRAFAVCQASRQAGLPTAVQFEPSLGRFEPDICVGQIQIDDWLWRSYAHRTSVTIVSANRLVIRYTLHFLLIAVLLGCPYLCFAKCDANTCNAAPSTPHATCHCGHDAHERPCEGSSNAPVPGNEEPDCDCLCKGAVYDSKSASNLDFNLTGWWIDVAASRICVIPGREAAAQTAISDDARLAGRTLRARLSSWLC